MDEGAVAIDLGASSGRFACGWIEDDEIKFEIVEQIKHSPIETSTGLIWDLDSILNLCERAVKFAESRFERSTIGIDSWGVDHGFLDQENRLLQPVVAYRDPRNTAAFGELATYRPRLWDLTGIQHQPFNTSNQLFARKKEAPDLPHRTAKWLILPDLLGVLLGGDAFHELTQASTTQLLGLDGNWSSEAFEIIGWPVPVIPPRLPGGLGGEVGRSVTLARVGSHDTASAVHGFGHLHDDEIFLNVGTWSLVGTIVEHPIVTPEAEHAGFSNERAVDGRVRFLKNVPGFFVVNRIHEELRTGLSVAEWLTGLDEKEARHFDIYDESLYNPLSMTEAVRKLLGATPPTIESWAAVAVRSLTAGIVSQLPALTAITGRRFKTIRVGGGGSQSRAFCQSLATESGLEVIAGPAEATVVGNLAVQFVATQQVSVEEVGALVARTSKTTRYIR